MDASAVDKLTFPDLPHDPHFTTSLYHGVVSRLATDSHLPSFGRLPSQLKKAPVTIMSKRGLSREEKRTKSEFLAAALLTIVLEIFHETVNLSVTSDHRPSSSPSRSWRRSHRVSRLTSQLTAEQKGIGTFAEHIMPTISSAISQGDPG